MINDKLEVYLEYDTKFRHALLTKFTHGQRLGSGAYRPESWQVVLETFVGTSTQNCISTLISRNKVSYQSP
jgi:hypothetical protein